MPHGRGNLGILGPMGIESVEKLGPAIFQNMRWDSISDKHTVYGPEKNCIKNSICVILTYSFSNDYKCLARN